MDIPLALVFLTDAANISTDIFTYLLHSRIVFYHANR